MLTVKGILRELKSRIAKIEEFEQDEKKRYEYLKNKCTHRGVDDIHDINEAMSLLQLKIRKNEYKNLLLWIEAEFFGEEQAEQFKRDSQKKNKWGD